MPNGQKKAFTLIEVLVCVAILAVAGVALLGSHANNTKMIGYVEGKRTVTDYLSIVAVNAKTDLSLETSSFTKTLTLYDIIEGKYDIHDDTLIDNLKKIDVTFTESLSSRIDLSDPSSNDRNRSALQDAAQDSKTAQSSLAQPKKEYESAMTLLVKKITASNMGNTAFLYKLEMQK